MMSGALTRRRFIGSGTALGVLACLRPLPIHTLPIWRREDKGAATPTVHYRVLSVDRLPALRSDFERLLAGGMVSTQEVFRSYLDGFSFTVPDALPRARSIIIAAVPDDIIHIDFIYRGVRHEVLVPPGYTVRPIMRSDLIELFREKVLGDPEARLEPVKLPLKMCAVRSGLARYGRNNITFVDGLGSYHALDGFYTERELPGERWQAIRMMRQCRGCDICRRECPTAALRRDRFVVDVGRCVTLYNELPDPMPEWIPDSAHNSLVGCLRCQRPCPANREANLRVDHLAVVSEEETAMLLAGGTDAELTASVTDKLARVGLVADLVHLERNLRLVLRS